MIEDENMKKKVSKNSTNSLDKISIILLLRCQNCNGFQKRSYCASWASRLKHLKPIWRLKYYVFIEPDVLPASSVTEKIA